MSLDYTAAFKPDPVESQFKKGLSPEKKEELKQLMRRDPLDPNTILPDFAEFEPILEQMLVKAEAHKVTDDATSAEAAEMASQARQLFNRIEDKRKEKLSPANKLIKGVNTFCKSICDRVLNIQRICESKNRPYLIEKETKRREDEAKAKADAAKILADQEKQRKLDAEAAKLAAEQGKEPPKVAPIIPVVVQTPVTETKIKTDFGSTNLVREWTWEIEDFRKLPDACLEARKEQIKSACAPWLNAQIKAGVREISGAKVFEVDIIKTRAK
jgi:hypothetical protein